MDHIKVQRTGLINTTFILVGAPTGGGGAWPLSHWPLYPVLCMCPNPPIVCIFRSETYRPVYKKVWDPLYTDVVCSLIIKWIIKCKNILKAIEWLAWFFISIECPSSSSVLAQIEPSLRVTGHHSVTRSIILVGSGLVTSQKFSPSFMSAVLR